MTLLVIKRAGQDFEEWDEDDYGNPLALEDMSDLQLLNWRKAVESLGASSPLAELMLDQVDEEIARRKANKHRAIGEI